MDTSEKARAVEKSTALSFYKFMEKLNRTLDGPYGIPIDIIVGTFLIVGLTEDDFGELLPEFVEKYEKMFHQPRKFVTYTDSEGKVHLDVDYCTPEE